MQPLFRAAAIAALALPLTIASADAQNYRGAFSLNGGGIWFSDFNDNGDFTDDDNLDNFFDDFDRSRGFADLTLDEGWVSGAQLEYWLGGGRFGIRANGAYTERSFKMEDVGFLLTGDPALDELDTTFGDVNTWIGDLDLMARIMRPERDRTWAPFVHIGGGVVNYNPAGEGTIVLPRANAVFGGDRTDGDFDFDDDIDDDGGNSETEFQLAFGIGTDVLPGWNLNLGPLGNFGTGIRLEVADHYTFDSPAEPLFTDEDFSGVHNVRFTAGLLGTFGELFPEERVAVAPAPPPPAPPEPEEERVRVCVIDPNMPERVEEVDAVVQPATGDTLVTRNGQRVALSTAYPATAPTYARGASWYVAGDPITLRTADRDMEFVSFGSSRVIAPEDLAFLGTYRGTPIYADRNDVMEFEDELEDAREVDDDLEDILEEDAELRESFNELDIVYTPVEPGCIFQPYRQVEQVRKVRG